MEFKSERHKKAYIKELDEGNLYQLYLSNGETVEWTRIHEITENGILVDDTEYLFADIDSIDSKQPF